MTPDAASLRVTLLGTSTSTSIPIINCTCQICTSTDTHDTRTHYTCYIETDNLNLVINTKPDFQQQTLHTNIKQINAVLFTHHHFDHIINLNNLQPFLFCNPRPIPCYARANTASVLHNMFPYIFQDGSYPGVPKLELCTISRPFEVPSRYDDALPVHVEPIEVFHGALPMYGYRIGRFAYLTDTNHIPEASFAQLEDLDVLVLDALRHRPHETHFSLDEAVAVAERIGARQTYFIHMTHNVLHAEEDRRLPHGIALGYDGLSFECRMTSYE